MAEPPPAPEPSRRGFLSFVTAVLGAVPILGGLFVMARSGLAPARSDRPAKLPLCRLDEIPEDGILTRAVSFRMRRGAAVENVSRVVFVTRDPDAEGAPLALAGECTHLSCPVQMRDLAVDDAHPDAPLRCPCHGGVFSRTGAVVAGPPPAPLRRLSLELPEDGEGMIHLLEI